MEWIVQAAAALVVGLALIFVLVFWITTSRMTRLKLRQGSLTMVDRTAVPEAVRAALDEAQPVLRELGFEYRYTVRSERTVVTDGDAGLFNDVYQHPATGAHAMVTPSPTPEHDEACHVMFFTLRKNGRALATVNNYKHNLLLTPPGWRFRDDYLPDLREAWTRHQARAAAQGGEVMDDGVEVFRAQKWAAERLMERGERKGMVVRRGEHWYLRWQPALRFAWRLARGQRRAAAVRRQAGATVPAAAPPRSADARVAADVQAFEQQLAVQRALESSRGRKWKMFVLTALAFLAVGSLWISWTFMPILLAVIALHEGGHYLAMRLSGYRNLSVFFVPGLGGLAMGEKPTANPWEKLFVDLAGPVPGVLLAVAGLVGLLSGSFQSQPWFLEFLLACLIINYFNLLPVMPLDGGRVVQTFLFARLPAARFVFAVLGAAAFFALGWALDDFILPVFGLLVGLTLPHQWRVMHVDRAIERRGAQTLGERDAIQRVFSVLQQPRFAGWPFAQRAATATALLPELQGRRANALESAGGIAIYLACLVGPLAAAWWAVPQLGLATMIAFGGATVVPDDVDPPAPAVVAASAPRDWTSQAARLNTLPEAERLPVLLGAAEEAAERGDAAQVQRHLQAAWALAQSRPAGDPERARTLTALASETEDDSERRQWRERALAELASAQDPATRLLRAQTLEQRAWDPTTPAAEKPGLLREVLAHRQAALPPTDPLLGATRLALARELDEAQADTEAEALLRRSVEALPAAPATDRSPEALALRTRRLDAQVDLAWFLIAQGRAAEAAAVLDAAVAAVPPKVTVSWEHPNRQAREAQLWAQLQLAQPGRIRAAWADYEASRGGLPRLPQPLLMHEIDRFLVARATADDELQAKAQRAITDSLKAPAAIAQQRRLCEPLPVPRSWREKQSQARTAAARAAGVCAKA